MIETDLMSYRYDPGKWKEVWHIRQKELDNREGNAHGMSEIRILAQGELVVLYLKSVWDTGTPLEHAIICLLLAGYFYLWVERPEIVFLDAAKYLYYLNGTLKHPRSSTYNSCP